MKHSLLGNALWSWAGHFIFIVAGFILPRFIDRSLGQELLGIWDFAWSLVGYLSLVQLGVGSSVNRYVAKYRAVGDSPSMNRAVSSVLALQLAIALTIVLLTLCLVSVGPYFWNSRLGTHSREAQHTVLFLGLSLALRTSSGVYAGVLTGHHRWDIYNLITSLSHAASIALMCISLYLGGSISSLAIIYTVESLSIAVLYPAASRVVCPTLEVSLAAASMSQAREMFVFGGKMFLTGIARTLLYQTVSMVILTSLGPASLAVYSRPVALLGHVRLLITKLAHLVTPVASELQAQGDSRRLQSFLLQVLGATVSMVVPICLFLCILGGPLIAVWMGPSYQDDSLLIVLVIGHFASVAHQPLLTTLVGLNAHGAPAVVTLVTAAASVLTAVGLMQTRYASLELAACCVGVSLVLSDGLYLTWFAGRKIGPGISTAIIHIWASRALLSLPFCGVLLLARVALPGQISLLFSAAVGAPILCLTYAVCGGTSAKLEKDAMFKVLRVGRACFKTIGL